jgi:hypothetical protein
MFNSGTADLKFTVPKNAGGEKWRRVIDTAFPAPYDIIAPSDEKTPPEVGASYKLKSKSVVVLLSRLAGGTDGLGSGQR